VTEKKGGDRGLRETARAWFRRLPSPVRDRARRGARLLPRAIRRALGAADPNYPVGTVRFGSLRRTTPFSRSWGYERGTPIDRVYIEDFLKRHAEDVRGACLEVLNADYTNRFGGARVTSSDVLDIDPANTVATIVADLGERDSLPAERFDCVIFTQTLHLIPDMELAVANVWRALSPGGVLLLTVPALGRHEARKGFHPDRWRVTKIGLEWLLTGLSNGRADITTYGNVLSCAAFLYGLAAEELHPEELQTFDREFPLVVAARVLKQDVR
jgi:SAM-dependent methyltransferase